MDNRAWFQDKVSQLTDPSLIVCCTKLLRDDRFFECPAALTKHQAYKGGLADHTREVMDFALAMANCESFKRSMGSRHTHSLNVLVTGILWHDYGKIWDYQNGELQHEYTRHRYTIRHLSRSYAEFMIVASAAAVDDELREEIGHIILAHHGRQEWGSPMEPLTPEASIAHFADCMSAYYSGKIHFFDPSIKRDWKALLKG
jgi:3'-5' exoribonuclease